jgi:CRP/FNR family cyclic AMP-dependent transcriptional regulator
MQTIDTLDSLIIKHPFLAGLNPHFYHLFADCASLRRFGPGQEVFHEGNDARDFYLIQSGGVKLEAFVPGCGRVTIQTLGPGEPLGWSWLFPPYQWHFTASATSPTELIVFDAASLRDKAEENRDFGNELLTRVAKILLQRLQTTRLQLIDLYGMRP